jgi:hypothetical protein
MKGIALETLAGAILAVIGVTLLIGVFSSGLGGGGMDAAFCSVYGTVTSNIPGSQPSPGACSSEQGPTYQTINVETRNQASLEIISIISECFEENQGSLVNENLCKGVNIGVWNQPINKSYLTSVMRENSVCPDIINSNLSTGNSCSKGKDQLELREPVESGDTVLFRYKYNLTENREYVEIAPSG